jgi:hypothetical protein
MTDASNDLPLAAEFPTATREQWRKLVEGVLKGAPFEKRLVAKTYDGLAVEPLYPRNADAQPVFGRMPGAAWTIMQRQCPGAARSRKRCERSRRRLCRCAGRLWLWCCRERRSD